MNRLLKNKKGQAEEYLHWFLDITLTAIVIIILAVSVNGFLPQVTSTHNLEYHIYSTRAINALSYQDSSTGRLYPGIIDMSKFTEETLNLALDKEKYAKEEFGIKLTLVQDQSEQELYHDLENYETSKVFRFIKKDHYVLVKSEEGLKPATLTIDLAFHRRRYPGVE